MIYVYIAILVICIFAIASKLNKKNNTISVSYAPGTYKMDSMSISSGNEALGETLKSMIREYKTSDDPRFQDAFAQIKTVTDEVTRDFFESMTTPLLLRSGYAQLESAKQKNERHNSEINLKDGEYVLFKYKSAAIFTVQKLFTEVSYGGARVAQGVFRAGAGTINSRSVEGLKLKDNGVLYVTNKRIIFIGNNNATTVYSIDKIVAAVMYEEDGILLKIANANPVVFNFNANFTYDSNLGLFDDSRLEAYNVIDSLVH